MLYFETRSIGSAVVLLLKYATKLRVVLKNFNMMNCYDLKPFLGESVFDQCSSQTVLILLKANTLNKRVDFIGYLLKTQSLLSRRNPRLSVFYRK